MAPDFSGYATKNGLKCSDGLTIMPGAFKNADGMRVPLVWQHGHASSSNILGHAILENREDGVYAYGYFNNSPAAEDAKEAVRHGDINALSIYANQLGKRGKDVFHGVIREVSLVLAGANPGALIDSVHIRHGDDVQVLDDEAIIYTGESFAHADDEEKETNNMANETQNTDSDETVKDVFDTLSEKQKQVVYYMVGEAVAAASGEDDENDENGENDTAKHSADYYDLNIDASEALKHGLVEGYHMARNVFESNGTTELESKNTTLSHSQIETIVRDGIKAGSLREGILQHADEYGITGIDILFPDAKTLVNSPEFIKRRTEWVAAVLGGTKHAPFAKIKSIFADITAEEARAKGYVKGNMKKEEVITLLKRTTAPTTVYKKQKLDRDDVLDITSFDVVAWLKAEIRLMLDEELARAILIGDGRSISSDDKIRDPRGATDGTGIRSIANDHDMYAHKVVLDTNVSAEKTIEEIARARQFYRGTGTPTMFTTDSSLTNMLLLKDKIGRRLYATEAELASALRVDKIVPVEVLEAEPEILAIIVNLADYTIGTNAGGEIGFFDDFDIDFNQNKYLMETRLSGALTRPKSALVIKRQRGTSATPGAPSFDGATNTISIPTTTGVIYTVDGEPVTGSVVIEADTEVVAVPDEGYYFPATATTSWGYTYSDLG